MRGLVIAAVVLVCAVPARAGGDLDKAQQDVDASDYLGARSALEAALAAGDASPDDLASIYKLTGIVEGALGNARGATAAFARWIALDPKAALPAGTSPKIVRPFEAAHRTAGTLTVKAETSAQPPTITVVIGDDASNLVARVRVHVSVDGKPEITLEGTGGERITIPLPHGKRLDLRVEALDEHGNRAAELGSKDVPIVITGAGAAAVPDKQALDLLRTHRQVPPPPHERPIYVRWWLWGALAVAFGAGGTYFGMQARSDADELRQLEANSSQYTFDQAKAVQSRGDRDALLFNIGMGTAGAFAIGAAILYLTEPRTPRDLRVSALPLPGGAAVVLGGALP